MVTRNSNQSQAPLVAALASRMLQNTSILGTEKETAPTHPTLFEFRKAVRRFVPQDASGMADIARIWSSNTDSSWRSGGESWRASSSQK